MKNNKSFSEAVAAGCIIAAIVVVLAECARAQTEISDPSYNWDSTTVTGIWTGETIELTPDQYQKLFGPDAPRAKSIPGKKGKIIYWNNSSAFKDAPSPKFLDWHTYPETWDGVTFTTWGVFAVSGALWGTREAYHADPYCFEKKWGVGSESFFGSDAWKRNYVGNNPDKGHKKETFGNVGRDIWHTAGFSSNALLLSGSFAIGARKQPAKYRALNIILGVGIRSAFASLTYNHFRQ